MTRPARLVSQAALVMLPVLLAAGQPTSAAAQPPPEAYATAIEAWRAAREAELRADDGWLTLVGLTWLKRGTNTVGSAPGSSVPLPAASAPATVGTIEFDGAAARFVPEPGVDLRIGGQPGRAMPLRPQPGPYDVVTTGSISFFIIQRGERFGVRVRDTASPGRREFAGLHWFPVRESYRVRARYIAYDAPRTITIPNVLGDLTPWPSPGYVVFTLEGKELRLYPVLEGENARELFFILRDATTGKDTYPGGRFLYADLPRNGEVELDFNKAVSPPCAFTAFATCPLPPRENALSVRIEAGELDPHKAGGRR